MVTINPAPNLHKLAGKSVIEKNGKSFKEYRRLWSERPRNFSTGNFPLFLDIEVTNMCNYRCSFCATAYFDESMKRGVIKPEFVKKIIDEGAGKGLCGVKFNDRGEPLLCKALPQYVKYAKKKGLIDVYFNTNASLLDEKTSRWIVESGLDRISISIEGTTPEIYEKYRKEGKFKAVLKNITYLKNLRDKMKSKTPKIRVQTVMLEELRFLMGEYAKFWSRIADEVCYIDYKEESKRHLLGQMKDIPWACHQLWQRMVIWWDGTILPCNEDDKGKLALGNISDMTIEKAWNSEKLNDLRKLHKEGHSGDSNACKRCYLRDSEIRKVLASEEKCHV